MIRRQSICILIAIVWIVTLQHIHVDGVSTKSRFMYGVENAILDDTGSTIYTTTSTDCASYCLAHNDTCSAFSYEVT